MTPEKYQAILAKRRAERTAERERIMAALRCRNCRGPMPATNRNREFCKLECRREFYLASRKAERVPVDRERKAENYCNTCFGLAHRRDPEGCVTCRKPWGPDIVRAEDHMWRASNLARVMGRATLYSVAYGSNAR